MSGREINIIRSRPRVAFTTLPNRVANDEDLSARALGVLYYILTKPPAWRVIPQQLAARFRLSYRVILTILAEIRDAGYAKLDPVRDQRGRIIGWRYLVSDEPGYLDDSCDQTSHIDSAGRVSISPHVAFSTCGKTDTTYKGKKGYKHPLPPRHEAHVDAPQIDHPYDRRVGRIAGSASNELEEEPPREIFKELCNSARRLGVREPEQALLKVNPTVEADLIQRQRDRALDDESLAESDP